MDRRADEALVSPKDFARMARVSTRTIRRWMEAGYCPKPFKLGGSPRWRLGIIRQWLWEEEKNVWVANEDKAGQTRTSDGPAEKVASKPGKTG